MIPIAERSHLGTGLLFLWLIYFLKLDPIAYVLPLVLIGFGMIYNSGVLPIWIEKLEAKKASLEAEQEN
jgi:hypothetical protein